MQNVISYATYITVLKDKVAHFSQYVCRPPKQTTCDQTNSLEISHVAFIANNIELHRHMRNVPHTESIGSLLM